MRRPEPQSDWPESWRSSFHYDCLEVWGEQAASGYARAYRARRTLILDWVRRVAAPGARILDIAAAQGNFTLALAELGFEVTWNDLRGELAGYVRAKHERGAVHFAPGNVLDMEPGEFDVVLACEVIEHVARPDRLLARIAGLVRPGGFLVMTTPNGEYIRNRLPRFSDCPDPSAYEDRQFRPDADGHIFLLHRDELHELAARAGLEVRAAAFYCNAITRGNARLAPLLCRVPNAMVHAAEHAFRHLPDRVARKVHHGMAVLMRRP